MSNILKNINEETIKNEPFAFFFDWFCSATSLENRALRLLPKLNWIRKTGLLDEEKYEVIFKNNAPWCGSLYDDIRIRNIETCQYLYICPRYGFDNNNGAAIIYTNKDNETTDLNFANWKEAKAYIKANFEELKEILA